MSPGDPATIVAAIVGGVFLAAVATAYVVYFLTPTIPRAARRRHTR